jgi:hypothetical protein
MKSATPGGLAGRGEARLGQLDVSVERVDQFPDLLDVGERFGALGDPGAAQAAEVRYAGVDSRVRAPGGEEAHRYPQRERELRQVVRAGLADPGLELPDGGRGHVQAGRECLLGHAS